MKEFLRWMQAGLATIGFAALQHFTSGFPASVKTVASFLGAALLVRAAGWVTAYIGPKPETPPA